MVNLEHKLTVDDLIVEYMMAKVNKGYETNFLTSEFISFLYYFESKMPVDDVLYNNQDLFNRFFERKNSHDWSRIINWSTNDKVAQPHMDMIEDSTKDDYLIKANYRLSDYDRSVINTYFMNKYDVDNIRKIIDDFLSIQEKRTIDVRTVVSDKEMYVGKCVTAEIITNIWNSYIDKLINNHEWPRQCKDINEYLFNQDLAPIIGLESIKNKLLEFYKEISKRVAVMYHDDKYLKISMYSNGYLAHSNYKLLIQGYENIFAIAFGQYKSSFDIDLGTFMFKESHELPGFYMYDDDPDVKTTNTSLNNNKVKEFVKVLDTNLNKE